MSGVLPLTGKTSFPAPGRFLPASGATIHLRTCMLKRSSRRRSLERGGTFYRGLFAVCALLFWSSATAQVPDIRTGQIPTLAPIVKETTPSVVNISVHARVKEDNPLYRDPVFR